MKPFNPHKRMSLLEDEGIEDLLMIESSFMAEKGYSGCCGKLREIAVFVMFRVAKQEKLDPFVAYLAMSYFDKVVSSNKLPIVKTSEFHNLELFILSCLSVSFKMQAKRDETPKFLDNILKRNNKFTREEFWKMELELVKGLKWMLHFITPFRFIDKTRLGASFHHSIMFHR